MRPPPIPPEPDPVPAVSVHGIPGDVDPARLESRTAVVIDVLRATTTAAAALDAGAEALVPVATVTEAFEVRDRLVAAGLSPLVCGERDGVRVPGFDLGNSPLEYTGPAVRGRAIVQCSTNGTGAMVRCAGARRVLLGALVNVSAVAAAVDPGTGPVALVCSGKEGRACDEDLAAAGGLLEAWGTPGEGSAAAAAREAWRACREDPAAFLGRTGHGRYLAGLGFGADLAACGGLDRLTVVPRLSREAAGPLRDLPVVRARG